MEVKSHQYSAKGFFYDVGIDGADTYANRGRWKLRRLSTIMSELGHTGVYNRLLCVRHSYHVQCFITFEILKGR